MEDNKLNLIKLKIERDYTIIKQLKLIYIFISLAFTYLVFKSDIFLEILNGKINYIILFVLNSINKCNF